METVKNKSGTFNGTNIDETTNRFLGIQYATAERFRDPVDILSYSEAVDATEFGPQSPQVPGFMEEILNTRQIPINENCLFLNIWAPQDSTKTYPVLFWIHGGAFTNGTGATSWYDGLNLSKLGDVVVVTINYRLGPFGFIGDDNFGLLDQISALRWVQRNIAAFGGDPNNVTVFGESAGGSSVVALTASPLAHGFLARGWASSPSLLQLRSKQDADTSLQRFLKATQCTKLTEVEKLSTEQIIDATAKMFVDTDGHISTSYISTFSPTCGGSGLPLKPYEASGSAGVPLVIGTNRDENRLWTAINPQAAQIDESSAKKFFHEVFFDQTDDSWLEYSQHRPNHTPAQLVSAMHTDHFFRAPAWSLCSSRDSRRAKTWLYWFTWATPVFDGALGCCHALDLPFLFSNLDKPNIELFTGSDSERPLISEHFTSELISFAKTGEVSWPQFADDQPFTLRIDVEKTIFNDPETELRVRWASLM